MDQSAIERRNSVYPRGFRISLQNVSETGLGLGSCQDVEASWKQVFARSSAEVVVV